jgi:hypothetical protein
LEGYHQWKNKSNLKTDLGLTFNLRRKEKEERERKIGDNLLKYLKLQPYTNR